MARPGSSVVFVVSVILFPCCLAILTPPSSEIKRQATVDSGPPLPGAPAEDLLPPPALSASFPTLRPRRPGNPPPNLPLPLSQNNNNNNNRGPQQPLLDLIPPSIGFRPTQFGAPTPPPSPRNPAAAPTPTPFPLLPPIEIPPERPLTDSEIALTLVPKESSFVPTTGQGATSLASGISIPAAEDISITSGQSNIDIAPSNNSSSVRFPDDLSLSPDANNSPPRNCPSCECTSEVDHICASNGVLYLNSCAFDCATFCDSEIRKVELGFCSSHNQI